MNENQCLRDSAIFLELLRKCYIASGCSCQTRIRRLFVSLDKPEVRDENFLAMGNWFTVRDKN